VTNKAWPKRILTTWIPDSMYFESFPFAGESGGWLESACANEWLIITAPPLKPNSE
jgi:hypothetical protein